MNTKIILVSSHRRSGTHFLIDTLLKNIPGSVFPCHSALPVDFNLGSILRKNDQIYETFSYAIKSNRIVVVKNHNMRLEYDSLVGVDKHEMLVKDIYERAIKLYVHRNPHSVMGSLYRYSCSQVSVSDYLREPNDHLTLTSDREASYQINRPRYLGAHVSDWSNAEGVYALSYEGLRYDFDVTIRNLFGHLNLDVDRKLQPALLPKWPKLHNYLRSISRKLSINTRRTAVAPSKRSIERRFGGEFTESDKRYIDAEFALGLSAGRSAI